MRPELLLAVAVLAGTGLVAGCLEGGEQLDPQTAPEAQPDAEPADDTEASDDDSSDDGSEDGSSSTDVNRTASADDGNQTETSDEAGSEDPVAASEDDELAVPATATIAHIDSGINPYHEAFRDDSELASVHPSEYIDGYPEDARALNLTLDADSFEEALEQDRDVWENVTEGELYWIPGTRIDAAITFGDGGVYCPQTAKAPPAPTAEAIVLGLADSETDEDLREGCEETPILDDHGHGTMTASRMAGEGTSLCPDCRIVSVESLGSEQVAWAAEQGWIDVQTNSWGSLLPEPVNGAVGDGFAEDIETAADEHLVYFASGNGAAGFFGFTPWPTPIQPTLREDTVVVGAHDNGNVAHWQGTPPHVVADAYRGLAAPPDTMEGIEATPFACCTSASSPYAAGYGARIVQEARSLLDEPGFGPEEGVFVEGDAGTVADGPLEDGQLTLDELRTFVKHTAEPRPSEGRHDGDQHWMGEADPGEGAEESDPWGPGGNPYCPGCVTSPVAWNELPNDVPAYPVVGYGGATPAALQDALAVLEGVAAEPDRGDVDEYFATLEPARDTVQGPQP